MRPTDVSAVARKRLRELRNDRGYVSAAELAAACRDRGATWITANVIENLEGSRRNRAVTIDELLVFAAVLEVPPLLLLMPAGNDLLPVLPDVEVDAARLVLWANGLRPLAGLPSVGFSRAAAPLAIIRASDSAIEAAKSADRALRAARTEAAKKSATADRDAAMQRLADAIRPLVLKGIVPPGLPGGWLSELAGRGWLDTSAVAGAEAADDAP